MQRFGKKAALVAVAVAIGAQSAMAAGVTMPTPNYTDIQAAASVGFAIVLTVGLLRKAKSFFR